MKKILKVVIIFIVAILILTIIDLCSIFIFNKPLFAIQVRTPYTYTGIFYNTYTCPEYSIPQIKSKSTKFSCAVDITDTGKVIEIKDKTKEITDFACAEALEEFYRDDEYVYYFYCMKSKYIVVIYESGYEEKVSDALKNNTITIKDLDDNNINYIKYDIKETE